MSRNTCCFFGHRSINETDELRARLAEIVEQLIMDENVDTFFFGSKSSFNSMSHEVVGEIKKKHPHIQRIYIRAEFPHISERYRDYLLKEFEDTYYPERILKSGKAAYIERNCEMIDKSSYCIVYYDEQKAPSGRKSGTKIALDYAIKKRKRIIRVP